MTSKPIVITILAILLYIIYYLFNLKYNVENYVGRNNVYILFNLDLNNYSVKTELNKNNSFDKTSLETYTNQFIHIYMNEGIETIKDFFISLPNNIKNNIKSITFPDSLKRIENEAFKNLENIDNLIFPSSLEHIGENAFQNCYSLKTIIYNGDISSISISGSAYTNTQIKKDFNILKINNNNNNYTDNDPREYEFRLYHATKSKYAGSNILGDGGEFFIYNQRYDRLFRMDSSRHIGTGYNKKTIPTMLKSTGYSYEKFVITKINDDTSKKSKIPQYSIYNRRWRKFLLGTLSGHGVHATNPINMPMPTNYTRERWEFHPVPGKINTFYIKHAKDDSKYRGRYINIHSNYHLYFWTPNENKHVKNQKIYNTPATVDLSTQGQEVINNIQKYTDNIIKLNQQNIENTVIELLNPNNLVISFNGELTSNYILNQYGPIKESTVILNEGITSLQSSLFKDNTHIRTIVIPTTVTRIHDNCFYGCTNLNKILFVPGSKLKYIYPLAFYNCNSLTEVYFPNDLEIIGAWAFLSCEKLNNVYFNYNSKIKYIDNDAFQSVSNFYAPPQMKYIYTQKRRMPAPQQYIKITAHPILNIPSDKQKTYITNSIINDDIDKYIKDGDNRVKISDKGKYRLFQMNKNCSIQIQSVSGKKINSKLLLVAAGGFGGNDGGYWGSGGGGAGEVAMGSYDWTSSSIYDIEIGEPIRGKSGKNSYIRDNGKNIIEVWGGGRGMDNPHTAHDKMKRKDIGGGAGGSGAHTWAPAVDTAEKKAKNKSQYFTFYSNRGGHGGGARGGGGGGGAGGVGGNRWGWEGGDGGIGIKWPINDQWYGGGGAAQGVNDYANRRRGGKGGGGGGGSWGGARNTGGGASAAQGRTGEAGYGGSGVCIFAFEKSLFDNKEIIVNIITDKNNDTFIYNKDSIDVKSSNTKCVTYQNKLTNKLSINSDKDLTNYGLLTLNYETKKSMKNETIQRTISTQRSDYNLLITTINDVKTDLQNLEKTITNVIIDNDNIINNDIKLIDINNANNESVLTSIMNLAKKQYNEIYQEWTIIINIINNMQHSEYFKSELTDLAESIIMKLNDKNKELVILCKNTIQKIQNIQYSKTNESKRIERINDIDKNAQNIAENEYKQYVNDLNQDKYGIVTKYNNINDDLNNKIKSYGVDEQTIKDDNNLIQNLEYTVPRHKRTIKNKGQEIQQLDTIYRKLKDDSARSQDKLTLLKYKEKEKENSLKPLIEKSNIIKAKNSLDYIKNQMDYMNDNVTTQLNHTNQMVYEQKKNKATNELIDHTLNEYNKIDNRQRKQIFDNNLENELLQREEFTNLNKQSYLDSQYKNYILHTESCKDLLNDSELCSIEEYDVDDEDIKIKCLEKELCLNKLKGIEFTNINDLKSSNKEEYNDKLTEKNNHLMNSINLSLGILGALSLIYTIK